MAANIQILLSLAYIVFGEAHVLDPNKSHSGLPNTRISHHSKKHSENRDEGNRYNQDGPIRPSEDQRPINGDIFSYNTQHSYNDYYQDGYPDMDSYWGYPGPFGIPNFDNMDGDSYGSPNFHSNYNRPGQYPPNKFTNEMDSHVSSNEKPERGDDEGVVKKDGDKKKSSVADEKLVDEANNKDNKNKESSKKENDKSVDLNAKKDYLLVDNNGHSYLLHENQPAANNVVYVPITQNNPQQPTNQAYQVVNGNLPVTANVPIAANKLNGYGNVMTYPAQGSSNNNNPAYIMVYANGQLIQIPGTIVNPPQNHMVVPNGNQGSNVFVNVPNNVQTVPVVQYPSNVMYANIPNQGNNQMVYQVPNTAAVSNNVPTTGVVLSTRPVVSPNFNNNNVGAYVTGSRPNYGNQIYQPVNAVNPNPAGTMNNPVGQPTVATPGVNNANVYVQPMPSKEKEPNAVHSLNNSPAVNAPVGNLQPVTQPPVATNQNSNGYLPNTAIQPAIMVSGFKESNKVNKEDKKEIENEKEKSKEEIKKKE